jgi:AraC family transcriptional regulator
MDTDKDQNATIDVDSPQYVDGKKLLVAGLRERIEKLADIPGLWQRALTYKTPKRVGTVDYGLTFGPGTDRFEYLAGFEVSDFSGLPTELSCVTFPSQKYAVFTHDGHVSELCRTCEKAGKWLEQSGHKRVDAGADVPDFFERYGEAFDPGNGMGGMEVWVPIGM